MKIEKTLSTTEDIIAAVDAHIVRWTTYGPHEARVVGANGREGWLRVDFSSGELWVMLLGDSERPGVDRRLPTIDDVIDALGEPDVALDEDGGDDEPAQLPTIAVDVRSVSGIYRADTGGALTADIELTIDGKACTGDVCLVPQRWLPAVDGHHPLGVVSTVPEAWASDDLAEFVQSVLEHERCDAEDIIAVIVAAVKAEIG